MNCICTDRFVRGCAIHDVVARLQAALREVVRLHDEGGPNVCCEMADAAAAALGDEERRTPHPSHEEKKDG